AARAIGSRTPATRTLTGSPPSLVADSRIEPRVEEVHDQVDEDETQCDDQHAALHQWKVTREDALHHQRADTRPGEDRLGEHRADQEVAGLHADDGDDRDERILQPVAQHDGALRSEEHTSELQSPCNLVCRLLLEKKKTTTIT